MEANQASNTALMIATLRGEHRRRHSRPWVLDDPYGYSFSGPAWPAVRDGMLAGLGEEILDHSIGLVCVRSRYAEDRFGAGTFGQYVLLGAGLDSFGWRRPDLLETVRVIEIDHPATQAYKRERVEALALPSHPNHVLVPVDFERETLRAGLDAAGFDWSVPAVFAWLGVLYYLGGEAIRDTLVTIATAAPGSEVVIDYPVTAPYRDPPGQRFVNRCERLTADAGEKWQTYYAPEDMAGVLTAGGLGVAEDLSSAEMESRYFAGRADGLRASTAFRLVTAVVPG